MLYDYPMEIVLEILKHVDLKSLMKLNQVDSLLFWETCKFIVLKSVELLKWNKLEVNVVYSDAAVKEKLVLDTVDQVRGSLGNTVLNFRAKDIVLSREGLTTEAIPRIVVDYNGKTLECFKVELDMIQQGGMVYWNHSTFPSGFQFCIHQRSNCTVLSEMMISLSLTHLLPRILQDS